MDLSFKPIVYTCVTNGYDAPRPVSTSESCEFVLLHDGSVHVPDGWRGRRLHVPDVNGSDLNRFAKMLPHRVFPESELTLYVDGNFYFKADPAELVGKLAAEHEFAAFSHPDRCCPYDEIRQLLRLGFVGPIDAARQLAVFRKLQVPRKVPLFEAGVLFRRHTDRVRMLCEQWWTWWQRGPKRDQPSLAALNWLMGGVIQSLGKNDVHAGTNPWLGIDAHSRRRSRIERLPNRLASELMLFRLWT